MLRVTINDRTVEAPEEATILQAARTAEQFIPTLCNDPRIRPEGVCRMCVVRVEGMARPVTACNTPATDGMRVATHTGDLEDMRRTVLGLLAAKYPPRPVEQDPDKQFHKLLRRYGLEKECRGEPNGEFRDDSHPYIQVDMARCVECFRCVRICNELQGQFVWRVWERGDRVRILPDSGTTLLESSCVSCGACVDTCPTGALEDRTLLERGVPTKWTRTTCPYCGTGCEMRVGTNDGIVVTVRPAMDAPVSRGHLCVKGRYAHDYIYAKDRVLHPMVRSHGEWKTVSWDEALDEAVQGLKKAAERYGKKAVGVLGSSRATNEENYVAQKFARLVLGTHNVDCCARVCHAPTAAAMKRVFGTGAATNSLADIEFAETILVCGANATENHPVAGARIKQAALRGANLIVVDPRKIELVRHADIHLQLRPGTNVPLFNSLAWAVIDEGLVDEAFISERVAEFEAFRDFVKEFAPEKMAKVTGVPAKRVREAARMYATRRPAICFHGLGMTEHLQGTEGVMAFCNLALITGNIGKRGMGVNPLRGQNNVQGSAHMGCEPGNLTGFVSVDDGRAAFEKAWGAPLPAEKGINTMKMMDEAAAGNFKALYTIGWDIYLTNADANTTRKALQNLECLIIQDLFLNETAKEFGTVFLPAAGPFEKDGTFMNADRHVQRVRQAIEPLGESRSDWEITCALAKKMGATRGFDFGSAQEIWDEVRSVWKAGAGMTYARLDQKSLQWPCPTEDHPGTQVLHGESFPMGKKASLRRLEYKATEERVSPEFPFVLVTGRTLYQFNAGTMTMRTPNVKLRPSDTLDVHPDDAARLGIASGAPVVVKSRYGEATLPARVTDVVQPGELFATFHCAKVFLNRVTSPVRDGITGTPEYKVTAVSLGKS